jgi:hypothetical protein
MPGSWVRVPPLLSTSQSLTGVGSSCFSGEVDAGDHLYIGVAELPGHEFVWRAGTNSVRPLNNRSAASSAEPARRGRHCS